MALQTNVSSLISPAAAAIPDTISARLSHLSHWMGEDAAEDFDARVDAFTASLDAAAGVEVSAQRVEMGNPAACYWSVRGSSLGRDISARLIVPSNRDRCPLVVMFHDAGRPVRGWHHMTRFAGIGMAVLALEQRDASFEDLLLDALALMASVDHLSVVQPSSIATWGEGMGGALALGAAALSGRPVDRCAVANPLAPALFEGKGSLVHLASRIICPTLVGTGLLDSDPLVDNQFALVNRMACPCRHIVYPKHGSERINVFEDRVLAFLLSAG